MVHTVMNDNTARTITLPPQIINDARELFKRGEWDAGALLAVQQMEAWILQGPPGFWERHSGDALEWKGTDGTHVGGDGWLVRSVSRSLPLAPRISEKTPGMIILCLAVGALIAYVLYQENKKVRGSKGVM